MIRNQVLVGPFANELTLLQDKYVVAITNSSQPVSDKYYCRLSAKAVDRIHDDLFGYIVKCACSLIKNQYVGTVI